MSTNIDAEAVQHYLEELKAGFTSRWIEVGGFPIHARVSEKQALADAPAVVFVHGLGLSSTYLLPIANELAADSYHLSVFYGHEERWEGLCALSAPKQEA